MKKKLPKRGVIAFFLAGVICLSVLITAGLKKYVLPFSAVDYATLSRLSEIEALMEEDYYYEVDEKALSDAITDGFVEGIGDPYSSYYPKESASAEADRLAGDSFGIGIVVINTTEGIYVWRVYEESPAEKAGIKKGDIITHVNGRDVLELGYEKSIENISGESGKKNLLKIDRNGEELEIEVKCGACDIQSVFAYLSENKRFGRIEVLSFNNKTHLQFKAALDYFQKSDIKGVVIDLRHNRGGTINSCISMLDYLLPETTSVYAKYKDGKLISIGESDEEHYDMSLAVLVDGTSASAAEIFACSLKEHNRAVLIGEKTYGKSVIQRSYDLSDGSRVKFTVGEYLPSSGESFNGVGIEPDIKVQPDYTESQFYFLIEKTDNVLKEAYKYLDQLS